MSDYRDSYNQFNTLYHQITVKYNIIDITESTTAIRMANSVSRIINAGYPIKSAVSLFNPVSSKEESSKICDKLVYLLTLMNDWLTKHHDKLSTKVDVDMLLSSINKRGQAVFHKFIDILYSVKFDGSAIDSYCRKTFTNAKTINYFAYGAKLVLKLLTSVPAINRFNSTLVGNIITSSIYELDNTYGYIYTKQSTETINRLKTVLSSCDDLLTSPLYSLKVDPMNYNTFKFAVSIYYMYTDAVYTTRSINEKQLSEYIEKLIEAVKSNQELLKSNKINNSNLDTIIAVIAFIKSMIEIMVRRNMITDDFKKLINYIK